MLTAARLLVLTMISAYSRWLLAMLLPSRRAEDLFAGWWELISRLGAVPRALVWDGEGAIGYLPRPKSRDGWFAAAVRRAGVQPITPHALRHSCASLSAGLNVLALQRMLGQKSAAMTLDTYRNLFDDDLDAVAASLHARYAPEDPTTAERR